MNDDVTYVIGYARVSTPKQAQTGESLEAQEVYIRRYCEKNNWKLYEDKVFHEKYSGKTTDRPTYNKILEILAFEKKRNKIKIKYFVFWDFDRLTRGGTEDYKKMWDDLFSFAVLPRDTLGVIQPETNRLREMGYAFDYSWAISRPSEQAEVSRITSSHDERGKILIRLVTACIDRTRGGYHIGRPDDGYKPKKIFVEGKKKCVLEQVPERAGFVADMFQLCAEQMHTDEEVCKILNAKGFRTPIMTRWDKDKTKMLGLIGGMELNPKQLRRYIERVGYAGFVCEKWTHNKPVPMMFEALPQNIVSVEIFNKANRGKVFIESNDDGTFEIRKNYSAWAGKRRKYNPDFPFRGVFACDMCENRKPMTASKSRGKSGKRYGLYHCSCGHKQHSYPQHEVETLFMGVLNELAFTDDFLAILERTLIFEYRKKEAESATVTAAINGKVAELERNKADTLNAYVSSTNATIRGALEEKIETLEKQIEAAKAQREKSELKEQDLTDFVKWAKALMEHPVKMLEKIHSINELHAVFGLIFDLLPTFTELTNRTPKLSLVFKMKDQMNGDNNQFVTPRGIEPRFTP